MGKKPNLNPLRVIKDKASFEGFMEGEYVQPVSPMSRLFHEPGLNIYALAIFGSKTIINPDVLKEKLASIVKKFKLFTSLQILDEETGSMKWVPTRVNLDDHVIVPELDPNMKLSDIFVEDYISGLSKFPINNSKPLWDLHILNTKTSDAEGTCVLRFHHSFGDGVSMMNLLLSCCHKASDPEALPSLPKGKVSSQHDSKVANFGSMLLILWNSIVALVMFILTVLFLRDTNTPLKGSVGVEDRPRRCVRTGVSLDDIKTVKNAMDVTVNDVVAGVIQAGLYRYLDRKYGAGDKIDNSVPKNIRLRAIVAFNMRASTTIDAFANTNKHGGLGNKIGYVLLPFSIRHMEDPSDYVRDAKNNIDRKKASLEPFWTSFFCDLVVNLFGYKAAGKLYRRIYSSVTLAFSNVPGPQEEISCLGHEVAYLAPSCYGMPMALLIHVVSYVDKVEFVVSVDEETIPDPQTLCDDLQQSFHLIKTSVLAGEPIKN